MTVEPIGKTIEAILKRLTLDQKDKQQLVYDAIMQTLNDKEKQHVRPWGMRNAILTLHIDSPTWRFALNLKKTQLLKGLQEKLGEDVVKEIRLRIGKV